MTSKLTSRFWRRGEAEATAPAEEAAATAETKAVAPEAAEAEIHKTETESPDIATVEQTVKSEDKAAATGPAPSRLIEVEKPKAVRPELAQAKAWLDRAQAYRLPAAAAAVLVLAIGAGYGIGASGKAAESPSTAATARLLEATARDLRDANSQIGQLAAELKAVRGTVDGIKGEREKSRGDILAKQTQMSERMERSGQENATRIGRLAEQLDRIEKAQRQGAADKGDKAEKIADKADKSDKVAALPARPAKPVDVAHTGSIGEQKGPEKIDPRKTPLEGYVVRDYDDGYALVETRSGRYIDVAVGYTLPGVGKVEAIERRGRQWVVVTPKGFIGER